MFLAGPCSVAFVSNLSGEAVDGLLLRFSEPAPSLWILAIGGDLAVVSATETEVLLGGALAPGGTCEVNWCCAGYPLESAAWLRNSDIVQEIDVHVPTARFAARRGVRVLEIDLCAVGSVDPDGLPLARYEWVFDDGVVLEGYRVRRAFAAAREVAVTLTVWDVEGKSASHRCILDTVAPGTGAIPSEEPYRIAFTAWVDGQREVLVINEDRTGLVRLTDNLADDWGPQWSPDGTEIAFYSTRTGDPRIHIMDADGSNQRVLVDVSVGGFDWGADGTIVFTGGGGLHTVDADGTNLQLVYAGDWSAPTISPDGETIAGHAYTVVRLIDSDGTDYREIPNPEGFGSRLTWRNDSQYGSWHGHVYVQIVDTISETRRTIATFPGGGKPGDVWWAPSGDLLVMYNPVGDSPSSTTYVYDFDGNVVKAYDNEIVRPWDWLPDSDTIAALAHVDGVYYLATIDLATDTLVLLYPNVDAPAETSARERYER